MLNIYLPGKGKSDLFKWQIQAGLAQDLGMSYMVMYITLSVVHGTPRAEGDGASPAKA